MALAESLSVTSTRGPLTFPAPDADRTVVWLRGEHDVSTVTALSHTLARAIALDDGDLVIDLSGVSFVDAATVGVIIRARDFLALQSRSLVLHAPSACAARVLDLCALADLLEPKPAHTTPDPAPARGAYLRLRANALDGAEDLQERARRGDVALLSLLRLDERTLAHRRSLAEVGIARLQNTRASRSTRFTRQS